VESCAVLDALQLPSDIVYGYCQPWDPIVRLFTQYDPLYPLIDDLGEGKVSIVDLTYSKPCISFLRFSQLKLCFLQMELLCMHPVHQEHCDQLQRLF
jgi:hypothetical protein